jgi:hypothetical protein
VESDASGHYFGAYLPFSYSSSFKQFGRGGRTSLPDLRFGELLNQWDMTFADPIVLGILARTLSNTDLELDNQVSVTESHPLFSKISDRDPFHKSPHKSPSNFIFLFLIILFLSYHKSHLSLPTSYISFSAFPPKSSEHSVHLLSSTPSSILSTHLLSHC